ncbi:MAG: AMP-binding protein [Thermomicrobiales bacterium]
METETGHLPDDVATIPAVLAFWAEYSPNAPAIKDVGGTPVTYQELRQRTHRIAARLCAHGIEQDNVVLIMLANELDQAIWLLGTASAAIGFTIDADTPTPEIASLIERTSARAAITDGPLRQELQELFDRAGVQVFSAAGIEGDRSQAAEDRAHLAAHPGARPDDPAVVSHTSGTTGRAKLIFRTHRHVVRSGIQHRRTFGISPDDRALSVAPLSLALGRAGLSHGIVAGACTIFPKHRAPAEIWSTIERERPTWMHASAGFLELLATSEVPPNHLATPSLRFVRVTAAAISPEVCDTLERWLGAPVLPSYSSIETGFIASNFAHPEMRRRGSVGKPLMDLRIVDERGEDVASGTTGEIWVRSVKVIDRYVDDVAANATAFAPGGWFRTGDAGYLDDDGFLFLTGRIKELINRGGTKISPVEVDQIVTAHPGVAEAAAFAIPDEHLGEDIALAVVLKPGSTVAARHLRSWMLDRMAIQKVPRRIWFLTSGELPRTASGKPQRLELSRRWREMSRRRS